MRLEIDKLLTSSGGGLIGVRSVANLLQQILYGLRSFPYYAFCVVAGLDRRRRGGEKEGAVYVYDAIGSYERVAVCCAGTGRELLQPILDRSFSPSSPTRKLLLNSLPGDGTTTILQRDELGGVAATTTADVSALRQRLGVAGGLRSLIVELLTRRRHDDDSAEG